MGRPMTLLLIEDDIEECEAFKSNVRNREDVRLIGVTNSSTQGIKLLKDNVPDGVVLDLELNKGEGSGVKFLMEYIKIPLELKPLLFVTTAKQTPKMYKFLNDNEVDFIFYKGKEDYSIDMVIETFLTMRSTLYTKENNKKYEELKEDYNIRAYNKIDIELDLIGISRQLKGWRYIRNAIFYLLTINFEEKEGSVFNYLALENKVASSTIIKAIQTAIINAWKATPVDELLKHYTARIHYSTGVPSPTEFIYYYTEKVKIHLQK